MQAIKSSRNLYRGINAHLHSFLQGENKWNRFHNAFIEHLTHALNVQLRPMGYVAEAEESMQVRRMNERRIPRSDVTIYDTDPQRATQYPTATSRTLTLTIDELIAEPDVERAYLAIGIYERLPDDVTGDQVAWIELLSPTNKGDHADAYSYQSKRYMLLESGVVVAEIDFLHETPPTFERLPDYTNPEQQAIAHPYRIIVLDPHPTYREGRAGIIDLDVDQAMPSFVIPLSGDEYGECDIQAVYDFMFEYKFYGDVVDYTQLPLHFDRYSPADQQRIVNKMLAIIQAHQAGKDLETVELQVVEYSLEDGLQKLKQATG